MNKRNAKSLAVITAAITLAGLALWAAGCEASGGVGGQGVNIVVEQTAPMPIGPPQQLGPAGDGDPVPLVTLTAQAARAAAGAAANISIVNLYISDGGTFANPSVGWGGAAVAAPTESPTTQPSGPEPAPPA